MKRFKQTEGVAMGSLLGPVLADIFMVKLENNIVPVLQENLSFWKQYVDDTKCFVKIGTINYMTKILNSFDSNINFTYDVEKDCKLQFLDVLLIKKGNNIITTIYRKATTNDIHLNWKSSAPTTWKRVTLKTLAECTYLICSSIALRKKEIGHLKKVFHEKNDYPEWVINQVLNEVEEKHKTSVNNVSEESKLSPVTDLKCHILALPYQGQKCDFIIKSMWKRLKTLLPDNVKTDVAFQGKQLSSCFNIKDKTKFPHKHDLVYHAKCAEESCNDDYVS